tara:strand:+ start:164 stop:979 length:816 start_codon:yes stop_codon:yes gene_type:complete
MHLSTNLLLLAATATGARVATHIVRFVDVNGAEQYGHVDPSEVHSLRNGVTTVELMEGDIFGTRTLTGKRAVVHALLAPMPKPGYIYGIGLNYLAHAHHANLTVPLHPAVFFKNPSAFNGPNQPVVIPPQSSLPDYEGELAFVFGKSCKDVSEADAMDCVLGFTVANDVSARCWQADTSIPAQCYTHNESYHPHPVGQWSFSKSFDTHCPLGPVLVMTSVIGDGSGLQLQTHLNGKLMQNDSTSDMIFSIPKVSFFPFDCMTDYFTNLMIV